MITLDSIQNDEALRKEWFPISRNEIFMGHAGVAPLPKAAVDALEAFIHRATTENQEGDWTWEPVMDARRAAAELVGCEADEIALLGPTSLGLNLVANGLEWSEGDEVVCYLDDYPANVYPWTKLDAFGVKPVLLQPEKPGIIDWPVVEAALTERTRLVALASCNYLSGYRIPIDRIGRELQARGILFSLDGIQ
ncbi:MAG: aminotransferase class V-fold PLP-dependent enzyme, partial [Verrucomicrobiota bacterium]